MVTVEELLDKAEEAPVLFMKFKDKVSKYGINRIYCFVEDYDMPYYSSIITALSDMEWTSIRCKGKEKVIEIHDYLKDMETYTQYKKRYFVDKDFDDNSDLDDDIYVTPSYSIENLYLTDDCMRKILETEYEIDPIDDEEIFNRTMALFQSQREEFHQAVLLFNAWYASLHEDPSWCHAFVDLDDKFPKELLKYSIDNPISCDYTLEDIENKYPEAVKIQPSKIEGKKLELSSNILYNLRGKYEIEFLYKFITFLNQDAGTKKRLYTKKKKNFSFNMDGTITAVSPYATIPIDLKYYIITGQRKSAKYYSL